MAIGDEPLLDIDDIQGHILVGFRGKFQEIVGLRLDPQALGPARAALLRWVDEVTSTRQALFQRTEAKQAQAAGFDLPGQDRVLLAMAITSNGLARFGTQAVPEDPDFKNGAARSAATLSDDVDLANGIPIGWQYGDVPERTPDVLAIFGGDDETAVLEKALELISDLEGMASVVVRDQGVRLPKDKEHFGFVDGISQPAPRGRISQTDPLVHRALPEDDPTSDLFARPGRPLIWPGQYIFGEPTQLADSLAPGPIAGGGAVGLKNGSLLVFRRLRQDNVAFREGMQRLADSFADQGLVAGPDTVAAWCVGRWPDGSPLMLSPNEPNATIGDDAHLRNGFLFSQPLGTSELTLPDGSKKEYPGAPADIFGRACPFFAHIRQVNPRDDPVDFGGSGITLQSQMIRRGIPYGPAWSEETSDTDRGLLFMSYQTSISNQFHRLMKRWVNDNTAPLSRSGTDPLIGVDKSPGRALERRKPDDSFARSLLDGSWVRATGGVYAFTPGKDMLRQILLGQAA